MHKATYKKTKSILEAVRAFNELVEKSPFNKREICSPRRQAKLVDERQKIAISMKGLGFTYPVIAHVMDRDHTSIIHLVRNRKKGVDN